MTPLPKCACGRTIPPPLKPLWPAAVFCQCGARHNFPRREASDTVREQARAMGRKQQAALRLEKAKNSTPGAGPVSDPYPSPINSAEQLHEAPGPVCPIVRRRGVGAPSTNGGRR